MQPMLDQGAVERLQAPDAISRRHTGVGCKLKESRYEDALEKFQ